LSSGTGKPLPSDFIPPKTSTSSFSLFLKLPSADYGLAMPDELLTIGEAAKLLDLSTQRIRQLESDGVLCARRTLRGMRIFDRSEVERLLRLREARVK